MRKLNLNRDYSTFYIELYSILQRACAHCASFSIVLLSQLYVNTCTSSICILSVFFRTGIMWRIYYPNYSFFRILNEQFQMVSYF